MTGLPAAQATPILQDAVLADPTLPDTLDRQAEELRYDEAQPLTGALSQAMEHTPNAELEAALASAKQIVGGNYHTCALTTCGGVKCWGYNQRSVGGRYDHGSLHTAVDVSGLQAGWQPLQPETVTRVR